MDFGLHQELWPASNSSDPLTAAEFFFNSDLLLSRDSSLGCAEHDVFIMSVAGSFVVTSRPFCLAVHQPPSALPYP